MKRRFAFLYGPAVSIGLAVASIAATSGAEPAKEAVCMTSSDPGFAGDIEEWVKKQRESTDPGFGVVQPPAASTDILHAAPNDEGFTVETPGCAYEELQDQLHDVLDRSLEFDDLGPIEINLPSTPEPSDS
jgi:hypothetical protein